MVSISLVTIAERLKQATFPETDLVIGIGTGGIFPAILVAFHLQTELAVMVLNYRDEENQPLYDRPVVLRLPSGLPSPGKKILLVDDVSVSGSTLRAARTLLAGYEVTTLTLKGHADMVLFPEIESCVNWPWKPPRNSGDEESRV